MSILSHDIAYEVDGLTMRGYLAQPVGNGPFPGVLIGHDGVGLDEYQRQRADDLAAHGYVAMAMEYHGGEMFFNRPAEMLDRIMPILADEARMRALGLSALDILLEQSSVDHDRIAALGYGAGGRIVLELAKFEVPFRAVAVVHPAFPNIADWPTTMGTFLLCAGSEDPLCNPDQIMTFGSALQKAGADWRVTIFGGAKHAFWACPRNADGSPLEGDSQSMITVPGVGFHSKHAKRSWRAVLELFDETFNPNR